MINHFVAKREFKCTTPTFKFKFEHDKNCFRFPYMHNYTLEDKFIQKIAPKFHFVLAKTVNIKRNRFQIRKKKLNMYFLTKHLDICGKSEAIIICSLQCFIFNSQQFTEDNNSQMHIQFNPSIFTNKNVSPDDKNL
jgi:hypothetical protein